MQSGQSVSRDIGWAFHLVSSTSLLIHDQSPFFTLPSILLRVILWIGASRQLTVCILRRFLLLCLTSSSDLSIDGVEFNTLPSGLHLVDRDVVYVFC